MRSCARTMVQLFAQGSEAVVLRTGWPPPPPFARLVLPGYWPVAAEGVTGRLGVSMFFFFLGEVRESRIRTRSDVLRDVLRAGRLGPIESSFLRAGGNCVKNRVMPLRSARRCTLHGHVGASSCTPAEFL